MNDVEKAREYVMNHISPDTALMMVMEEASEVIKECAKVLRCKSDDPFAATPASLVAATSCLLEEMSDLIVAADAARILPYSVDTSGNIKWIRWANRAKAKEE